jgi:hypothetical protein
MLRKHSKDQLDIINKEIKSQGGDISSKVADKYTKQTLDHPIDLSDDEPNANMRTDPQLRNLPKNSLITKFKDFKGK